MADSLSYLVRPLQLSETLFQIKNKMGWRCSSEVERPWVPSLVPQKKIIIIIPDTSQTWWHMLVIPAFGRLRQEDLGL